MRLDQEQESQNIEDRRGFGMSRGVVGGGIGTIVIVLIGLFFGIDPSVILQGTQQVNVPQNEPSQPGQGGGQDEMRDFVARGLGSTERTWSEIFQAGGRAYEKPTPLFFFGARHTAWG